MNDNKTLNMPEWQKLQAGEIYNDFDQDLFNRRIEAKQLFRAYNRTEDNEVEKRKEIMQKLFKSVGKNVWIEPDFRCEFGKNITIGSDVYINLAVLYSTVVKSRLATTLLLVRMSVSTMPTMYSMPRNALLVD